MLSLGVFVLVLCLPQHVRGQARGPWVRQFNSAPASPEEAALLELVLADSTPDRYRGEEYFTRWGEAGGPRVSKWAWSSCGGPSDLVFVGNISVSPDPIKLPGTLIISAAAKVKEDIPSPIQAELRIRKKVGLIWISIPCIDNVGSCTYPDVCQMLSNVTCPAPVVTIGQNCRCPIKKSDGFVMQPSQFIVNGGGAIPTGDYQIQASASHQGQQLACIDISFTIEH